LAANKEDAQLQKLVVILAATTPNIKAEVGSTSSNMLDLSGAASDRVGVGFGRLLR